MNAAHSYDILSVFIPRIDFTLHPSDGEGQAEQSNGEQGSVSILSIFDVDPEKQKAQLKIDVALQGLPCKMEFTVAERIVFHDALPNTEGLADVIMYETDNTLIAFARAKVVSILREADWDPIYLPPLKNAEQDRVANRRKVIDQLERGAAHHDELVP